MIALGRVTAGGQIDARGKKRADLLVLNWRTGAFAGHSRRYPAGPARCVSWIWLRSGAADPHEYSGQLQSWPRRGRDCPGHPWPTSCGLASLAPDRSRRSGRTGGFVHAPRSTKQNGPARGAGPFSLAERESAEIRFHTSRNNPQIHLYRVSYCPAQSSLIRYNPSALGG